MSYRSDSTAALAMFTGVLFIFTGMFAFFVPHFSPLFFEHFLGWLLLIVGIAQFVQTFADNDGWPLVWTLLLAALYIFAGIVFIENPYGEIGQLTAVFAAFFCADGILKVLLSYSVLRFNGWSWVLMSGLLSTFLSFMLFAGLPGSAIWVIGGLFGMNMAFTGISVIIAASALQRLGALSPEPAYE